MPAFEIKPESCNDGLIDEAYMENQSFIDKISLSGIFRPQLDTNIRADNPGFIYPDSNNGGDWRHTNPQADQQAMQELNKKSQGLLCDWCRHLRYIRDNDYSSYHIQGILIDSFCYDLISKLKYPENQWESIISSRSIANLCYIAFLRLYNLNNFNPPLTPSQGKIQYKYKDIENLKKVVDKSYSINSKNRLYQWI